MTIKASVLKPRLLLLIMSAICLKADLDCGLLAGFPTKEGYVGVVNNDFHF